MNTGLVEIPDFKLNVRTAIPYQDLLVACTVIADDEYDIKELAKSIPTPNVILDVGGHIGTFGLLVKSIWPDTKLIAVEPSEENATLYEMNLKSNGFDNTTVIHAAVNYKSDRKVLVHSSRTSGGNILLDLDTANEYLSENYRKCDGFVSDNVKSITIEDIIKDYDVIDLAKFDCEGSEQQIFENMTQKSADKFRYIVGEYHYWTNGMKLLERTKFGDFEYWNKIKRKFKHLNFSYHSNTNGKCGIFRAWPKNG